MKTNDLVFVKCGWNNKEVPARVVLYDKTCSTVDVACKCHAGRSFRFGIQSGENILDARNLQTIDVFKIKPVPWDTIKVWMVNRVIAPLDPQDIVKMRQKYND